MNPLLLSLAISAVLFVWKIAVGLYTGSFSILAESMHSLTDIVSATTGLLLVRLKKEYLSHKIEAIILSLGAFWVFSELFQSNHGLDSPILAGSVCLLSLILYSLTYRHNHKHAHSHAVKANLAHLLSDMGGSIITLVGLLIIYITGWTLLDKVIAVIICLWLLYLALRLLIDQT